MTIPAALVKELRERTGAGMMECKKALQEANGDMDTAIELMRKSGQAKAAKKAGRIAAEGLIVVQAKTDNTSIVLVEVNCETDFVAKDAGFRNFAQSVGTCALNSTATTIDELLSSPLQAAAASPTVQEALEALVIKLGEHLKVRRFERVVAGPGHLFNYIHGTRIGVIIEVEGGDDNLGKDLAMHIAATNPMCLAPQDVPATAIAKEREIFTAQAAESGKPPAIIEKMVEGRVRKFLEEITLLGQPFVKNPEIAVGQLLTQHGAKVHQFKRMEVGEGIEKKKEDFAAEVAAQVRSA